MNQWTILRQRKIDTLSPPILCFRLPWCNSRSNCHKNGKFQPNLFHSFGGDISQIDRQQICTMKRHYVSLPNCYISSLVLSLSLPCFLPFIYHSIPCWPTAAGASLGVTQKAAAIIGLGQTGHPKGATDYHRWPCILCRRSSHVEQFVVINAECTFVACI